MAKSAGIVKKGFCIHGARTLKKMGVLVFSHKKQPAENAVCGGDSWYCRKLFNFVGLPAVMLCKGFNFIATHVLCFLASARLSRLFVLYPTSTL